MYSLNFFVAILLSSLSALLKLCSSLSLVTVVL